MSAKRKNLLPADEFPSTEALAQLLQETLDPAELHQIIKEARHPELKAAREALEAKQEEINEFVNALQEIPAGYVLPEGFDESWEQLLADYEEDIRSRFIADNHKPGHVDAWVRRGWITADVETRSLISHTSRPADETHPIPVILTNDTGKWTTPTGFYLVLKLHPFVRAVSTELPEISVKEQVMDVIRRSILSGREGDYHSTMLAQAADSLDLWIYDQDTEDSDYGWLHVAKEGEHFWQILNAAIGFGRALATHEVFGDGSVESLIRRALVLSVGKRATGWRHFIENELKEVHRATGEILTPAQLREHLGSELPGTKDAPMVFSDERCASLPEIKWPEFQTKAKKAAQKLDL